MTVTTQPLTMRERVIDAAMTGYDRSRGFDRRFTDYYPTLLEDLAGLEARVRVAHFAAERNERAAGPR